MKASKNPGVGFYRFLWLRFGLVFLAYLLGFSVLVLLDEVKLGGATHMAFDQASARVVWSIMRVLGSEVVLEGNRIITSHGIIQIVADCTGADFMALFAAAVLSFPVPWRRRLMGLAIFIPVLEVTNLIRMVTLVYLSTYSARWLHYGHIYVWPMVLFLLGLGMWLTWARREIFAVDHPA